MNLNRRFLTIAACALLAVPALAKGTFLPATGTPILEITHGEDRYSLDINALQDLPATSFQTSTIWTVDLQSFRGVRLADLLDRLEITDGIAILTAANDYQISIDIDDIEPDGALIAYERNGAPMTLRDKGPLWLVYPYDDDPKFRTEVIYANSIWQLDRIEFSE